MSCGMSPYQMVFGKASHLAFELEHKAMCSLKNLNLNWSKVAHARVEDLNEIDKFRLKAYESTKIYKMHMKHFHDQNILKRKFVQGDWVLLFNSRLRLFPKKLKSKWSGPF